MTVVTATKAATLAIHAIPLSPIAQVITALYRMGEAINESIDSHIDDLKRSENETISTTGRVLEAAKLGFGLGYLSSVTIMATGQFLLGNVISAATTVATAAVLSNPIAMTCAAVGAIVYGWSALSTEEQQAILDRLTEGLEIGAELIRTIIDFVIRTTKSLLSSKQLAEFKEFISTQAATFGRSLYDVTKAMGDFVKGAATKVSAIAGKAYDATKDASASAANAAAQAASTVAESTSELVASVGERMKKEPKALTPPDSEK